MMHGCHGLVRNVSHSASVPRGRLGRRGCRRRSRRTHSRRASVGHGGRVGQTGCSSSCRAGSSDSGTRTLRTMRIVTNIHPGVNVGIYKETRAGSLPCYAITTILHSNRRRWRRQLRGAFAGRLSASRSLEWYLAFTLEGNGRFCPARGRECCADAHARTDGLSPTDCTRISCAATASAISLDLLVQLLIRGL